jgi:ubiquinone/menaquinone biosynthesis C-methylase UbiE
MTGQKESVKSYFNNTSGEYSSVYAKDVPDSLRAYIFLSRREYVLNMLDLQGGKVLDIGCGPGVLTENLLKRGCQVWNIDISEAMVEKAGQRMQFVEGRDRAHFSVGDIEKLEFPNKFFDAVLCVGVLEYLPDDILALKEIFRVLRPGGSVIFTVPNLASPFVLLEKTVVLIAKFLQKIFPDSSDSLLFRKDIIDRYYFPVRFNTVLKKNGFKIDKTMFHVYRLAFLNYISCRLSLSFARRLEFFSKTPLCWMGVNYIVRAQKE